MPDILVNHCPEIDLGTLSLYRVSRGHPTKIFSFDRDYRFRVRPKPRSMGTHCYRGYVSEYELRSNRELRLCAYTYPEILRRTCERTVVNEPLTGDFWLTLRSGFAAPPLYVPAISGRICADETQWLAPRDTPLQELKYPERTISSIEALSEPVLLGHIASVSEDDRNDDVLEINCDRDFPEQYFYCQMRIVRSGDAIFDGKIIASSGGAAGPWVIYKPQYSLRVGDQIWATGRVSYTKVPAGMASPNGITTA